MTQQQPDSVVRAGLSLTTTSTGPSACWTNCWRTWRVSTLTLQACVVASLVLLSQVTLIVGADADSQKYGGDEGKNVTVPAVNLSTAQNVTTMKGDSAKSNTGTVVAVSVICVLLAITVVLSVYFFRRKRHTRMMDKEKKMQIQMSSARNAGVYQDLTVSVPVDDRPPASPEHERLRAAEDA